MLCAYRAGQCYNTQINSLDSKFIVSRESLVLLLGIITFTLPLIGVTPVWKEYGQIAIGVLLVFVGFSLRRSSYYRKITRSNGEISTDSFAESQPTLLDYTPEEVETDK